VSNSVSVQTSQTAQLTVSAPGADPLITQHPQSVVVNQGQNATFTIAATGTLPISYQWYEGDVLISGATATNYTRVNCQANSSFFCVVSNAAGVLRDQAREMQRGTFVMMSIEVPPPQVNPVGTQTSQTATLTVNFAPPPPPLPTDLQMSGNLNVSGNLLIR
jgi:hypothetical protein